ncbi:MAG: hypothetical protein NC418_07930 [Muribaculaceae bacterium]|nr:hypothetical protein [Muribaculaceae bacterium]
MKKTMIIGVGGAGCNMANTFRREAKSDSIKNAIYVFADHRRPEIDYFEWADDFTAFLNLYNINLYNDLPDGFLKDVEKVYVLAGLGGQTGTAWTPVIARFAKFSDVKYVSAIVTTPFIFEGERHLAHALDGLTKIKDQNLDLVIALNNEKLAEQYANINFSNAFDYADKAVLAAIEENLRLKR